MTDEFPGAFRNVAGDRVEQSLVECSSDYNAEGAVGGREPFPVYGLAKLSREAIQDADLYVASPKAGPRQQVAGSQWQARTKRIAQGWHPAGRRRAEQRAENLGEQVGVFVSVDVRNGNAGGLKLANLRCRFRGDLVGVHAAGNSTRGECHHAIAEVRSGGEGGKLFCAKNGVAIGKHNMATDAELPDSLGVLHGLRERQTIGHKRRRSDDAVGVSFDDGTVHARSVAKIICVDDQTPHAASLAGRPRDHGDAAEISSTHLTVPAGSRILVQAQSARPNRDSTGAVSRSSETRWAVSSAG